MTEYQINLFFSSEDGGYIADIPDLEACSAFGATPEEALSEVERAKAAWLAAAQQESQSPGAGIAAEAVRGLKGCTDNGTI
jgi:predicted RNase H-like HicB family nuclease